MDSMFELDGAYESYEEYWYTDDQFEKVMKLNPNVDEAGAHEWLQGHDGDELDELWKEHEKKVNKATPSPKGTKHPLIMAYLDSGRGHRGVSTMLLDLLRPLVRCIDNKTYLCWRDEEKIWVQYNDPWIAHGVVSRLSKNVCDGIRSGLMDEETKKHVRSIMESTASMTFCRGVWERMKTDLIDRKIREKINKEIHLFPFGNDSVVDLRTGEVRQRVKEDHFTYTCETEYKEDADLSIMGELMNDLMLGDTEMIDFMQESLGYCITGSKSEEKIFFWWGTTRNGKSTLQELIDVTLGDGLYKMGNDSIFKMKKNPSSADPFLASLVDARVVIIDEGSVKGKKVNEAQIKRLTSDGRQCIRSMYGKAFNAVLPGKFIVVTNELPDVSGCEALWERLVLVPFLAKFVPHPTQDYERKLVVEKKSQLKTQQARESCLRWLVEGAIRWYKKKEGDPSYKIPLPEKVRVLKEERRAEVDSVGEFLLGCIPGWTPSSELHQTYTVWCAASGHSSLSIAGFRGAMRQRGHTARQKKMGGRNLRCYNLEPGNL